jgi:hypothetical protein
MRTWRNAWLCRRPARAGRDRHRPPPPRRPARGGFPGVHRRWRGSNSAAEAAVRAGRVLRPFKSAAAMKAVKAHARRADRTVAVYLIASPPEVQKAFGRGPQLPMRQERRLAKARRDVRIEGRCNAHAASCVPAPVRPGGRRRP